MILSKSELLNIFNNIENEHPNLYHSISKDDFLIELNKVYNNIENMNKSQVTYELLRLFALFKDGHTTIYEIDEQPIPLLLKEIDGDIYIVGVPSQYKTLLLKKISHINNKRVDLLVEKARILITAETREWRDYKLFNNLRFPYFLESLGLESVREKVVIRVDYIDYVLNCNDKDMNYANLAHYDKNYELFTYQGVNVIRMSSNLPDSKYPLNDFYEEITKQISNNDFIVVDLRNNEGGPSTNFEPVVDILKEKCVKGCCLINNGTFSGGTIDYKRLKNLGFISIGEKMGQPAKYYGNSGKKYDLLNLGLRYRASTQFFDLNHGGEIELSNKPDIELSNSIEDYCNNYDRVLDKAVEIIKSKNLENTKA